jgi:hypothetical protein
MINKSTWKIKINKNTNYKSTWKIIEKDLNIYWKLETISPVINL